MRSSPDRLWMRLVVLCGRAWGMPPGLVRSEGQRGAIALEEAYELYLLEQTDSEGRVGLWVRRERELDRRQRVERARTLVAELRGGVDDRRRGEIETELAKINGLGEEGTR